MSELSLSAREDSFESKGGEYEPTFAPRLEVLIDIAACNAKGTPDTFGATPLNQFTTMHQQAELMGKLSVYAEYAPEDVPPQVAEFVRQTFRERFVARGVANDENFNTSLLSKRHYADNHDALALIDRAEQGSASPAELLLVRQVLGIRSVELACLTHTYGRRLQEGLLDQMRSTVRSGVLLMEGKYEEDPQPVLRIKDVILNNVDTNDMANVYSLSNQERIAVSAQYGGIAGILITRKRNLGKMPDGTIIKERSSLILRADEKSMVTKGDVEALIRCTAEGWEDTALQDTELDQLVLDLMETNKYSYAIPISSTIYAYNVETEKMVFSKQATNKNTAYEQEQLRAPALVEASSETQANRWKMSDVNGMAYFGPEEPKNN